LSNALNIETPVRSMSMGCVSLGRSRSISVTGPGNSRSLATCCCEFLQLLRVRQLSIEQQISDLLESGLLGHPMNVVAPIHQPGSGIDPADRRLTGDYPASPGLYCGFVSVPMLFADCNYDTRADKSSVAQAQPFLCSWIVVEQFVKLLARLHFIEPFLLGPLSLRARRNSSLAFIDTRNALWGKITMR
jgi:hypothetical protein